MKKLLLAVSLSLAVNSNAAQPRVVYVKTDASAPADSAALVVFGQKTGATVPADVRLLILGIDEPDGLPERPVYTNYGGTRFTDARAAVVAAGRYVVKGYCALETYVEATVELEGGKRYLAYCTGKRRGHYKLVVEADGASP